MRRLIVLLLAASPLLASSDPVRIMPLGDSITHGLPVPGGYRTNLYSLLSGAGHTVDFVGGQTSNPNPGFLPDSHHEGHPGWQTIDLSANIVPWLLTYDPEIVLLHIGTNDISFGNSAATVAGRLNTLMTQIVTTSPDAHLIVASIVPRLDALEATSQAYNAHIPGLVSNLASNGHSVSFVNIHDALGAGDLTDVVHPNASGYNKMATQWFQAVQAVPEPGTVFALCVGTLALLRRRKK